MNTMSSCIVQTNRFCWSTFLHVKFWLEEIGHDVVFQDTLYEFPVTWNWYDLCHKDFGAWIFLGIWNWLLRDPRDDSYIGKLHN